MVVNGYRYFVGDMKTGRITADLALSSVKWGTRLNGAGPLAATLRPLAEQSRRLNLRANTTPRKQFFGVAYGDHVLEAGPIWRRNLPPGGRELAITAAGLWSILDKRKLLNRAQIASGVRVQDSYFYVSGVSLGTMAAEMVRSQVDWSPDAALPIVFPDHVNGVHENRVDGFSLPWLGEELRKLTARDGGPDIEFRPRYVGGDTSRIEWVMNTGTDDLPLLVQAGGPHTWDGTVDSGVEGFGVDEDGTTLADKVYVPGPGQERAMMLAGGYARTLLDDGHPFTERDESSKDVEDQGLLQGYADRLLGDSQDTWSTYSVSVRADTAPRLGTYTPGDVAALVTTADHPVLPGGRHLMRIMAADGDHTATVKLTVAPILGDDGDGSIGESVSVNYPDNTPALYPGDTTFPGPTTYPSGGF